MYTKVRKSGKYGRVANMAVGYVITFLYFEYKIILLYNFSLFI